MLPYNSVSDSELISLLREGNHAAYTEIYERYWGGLFRHARKMLRSDDDASDVVQEIFTTLWHRPAELNLGASLTAYLYTAVRNKTINYIDHRRVRETYLDSLENFIEKAEYITDDLIRQKEFAAIIENEIMQLPPKMREVFELSRKSHLSYKEIAQQLNISDNTVKKQTNKALNILRLKLNLVTIFFFMDFFR